MKRKYRQLKSTAPQENLTVKALLLSFPREGVIVLFVLELLVALGVTLPHSLAVAAPVFATVAGGASVFFHVVAPYFEPLLSSQRTVLYVADKVGCFILFVVSLFGVFFDPVPQFILWVNVLILSRWLYDAIVMYVNEWRGKSKRRLTDADCPDKIERPTDRRGT